MHLYSLFVSTFDVIHSIQELLRLAPVSLVMKDWDDLTKFIARMALIRSSGSWDTQQRFCGLMSS